MAIGLQPPELATVEAWCVRRGRLQTHLATSPPPPPELVELVVLDVLASPGLLSEETCHRTRVVCVGGTGATPCAARALRAGALDYVLRSCDSDELAARLDAAMSRASPLLATCGARVQLNEDRCSVSAHGDELLLRPAEYEILRALVTADQSAQSAHALQKRCLRVAGDGASVRNHVYEIRERFRRAGWPDPIDTRRGVGYRITGGLFFVPGEVAR